MKDPNKNAPGAQAGGGERGSRPMALSVYLRCLNVLDAAGVRTVSSQALAEQFHLNAAQIARTSPTSASSACEVSATTSRICAAPAPDPSGSIAGSGWRSSGAGNLGMALADYAGFRGEGFEIAALFDTVREIGQRSRRAFRITTFSEFRRLVQHDHIRGTMAKFRQKRRRRCVNTVVEAGVGTMPSSLEVPAGSEAFQERGA